MLCNRIKSNYIPIDKNGELDLSNPDKLFSEATKIISVTHVSNVLGTINPIKKLSKIAKSLGAIFVVDIRREHIAVREALKLNIPIFAMVDTNADPRLVDFGIPANDDASKSIEIILNKITSSIKNGLELRNKEKQEEEAKSEKEDTTEKK